VVWFVRLTTVAAGTGDHGFVLQGFIDILNRIDGEGTYHRGVVNELTFAGERPGLVDHSKTIQNHR